MRAGEARALYMTGTPSKDEPGQDHRMSDFSCTAEKFTYLRELGADRIDLSRWRRM
jgi:hypothetical protein